MRAWGPSATQVGHQRAVAVGADGGDEAVVLFGRLPASADVRGQIIGGGPPTRQCTGPRWIGRRGWTVGRQQVEEVDQRRPFRGPRVGAGQLGVFEAGQPTSGVAGQAQAHAGGQNRLHGLAGVRQGDVHRSRQVTGLDHRGGRRGKLVDAGGQHQTRNRSGGAQQQGPGGRFAPGDQVVAVHHGQQQGPGAVAALLPRLRPDQRPG